MKLKSYFSGTVEAAMSLARQELGDDALLINARPATPETRYLGAYEVVFGVPPRTVPPPPEPAAAALAQAAQGHAGNDRLAQEVAGLKREFERVLRAFQQNPGGEARAISSATAPAPAMEPAPACQADATLGRPGAARAVVALVGPPGVGKTTTLVKLAARYGLAARRPAQILSTDVYRIAAADQLRSLASILGIGCEIAETAGALAQLLEEHRSRELVFIDTPGLARADMADAVDLASLLASHAEIDTHLVLPAFMRASDMARAVEQYAVFRPRKLLFTRLDETDSYADLAREAARHSLPLSFLGTGQEIPDDLVPADPQRIEELLDGRLCLPARMSLVVRESGAAAQRKGAAA